VPVNQTGQVRLREIVQCVSAKSCVMEQRALLVKNEILLDKAVEG
jgi:hypothetical protein